MALYNSHMGWVGIILGKSYAILAKVRCGLPGELLKLTISGIRCKNKKPEAPQNSRLFHFC